MKRGYFRYDSVAPRTGLKRKGEWRKCPSSCFRFASRLEVSVRENVALVKRSSSRSRGGHQEQISESVMDPLRAQQLAAELEVEMMADMYNRMTNACHRKCVPPHYKEAELSKGESVCLDRCVSKYLDIHERMGKKLTELSMQDEELMKRMQQGAGPA